MYWAHTCHALRELLAAFPLLRMLCLDACELRQLNLVRAATFFEIVLHLRTNGMTSPASSHSMRQVQHKSTQPAWLQGRLVTSGKTE